MMLESSPGIIAWSLVTSISLLGAGLSPVNTFWFNILVYAGSSQLAVMPLIAGDYPFWTVWLTALIVMSRFVIFSAVLQPHFKHYSFWQRLGIGSLNTDMSFAKFVEKFPSLDNPQGSQVELLYFMGMVLAHWFFWQIGALIAIFFGSYIPISWGLGFAGPLALLALIIPAIKHKTAVISALAAAGTCILTINLPYRLTIVCSVIAGVMAAVLVDKQSQKRNA
ncbi:AzlC family ABC transporter permease [Polynucleobacter sp. UB-Siik-W21]|nr:AzlC family ABC transporter permease [Polynucleobacter sp. UB-Siik-W21]